MNRQGFVGSCQQTTSDAQMPMGRGLDLNFPPPEQNINLNDTLVGTSAHAMQAQVNGQLQPQPMNNFQVIDDEISIISPMDFSEAKENRIRKQQGTQLINENMGVQSGFSPMSNDVEVHSSYGQMQLAGVQSGFGPMSNDTEVHSSYDQMLLAGDMHVYHGHMNSERTPVFADPSSYICPNLQVVETVQEKEVTPVPVTAALKCPICISPLYEATSTRCGHVFCKACIEAAIKAQHKCPTCRRKLKKNDIIRIYLPAPA